MKLCEEARKYFSKNNLKKADEFYQNLPIFREKIKAMIPGISEKFHHVIINFLENNHNINSVEFLTLLLLQETNYFITNILDDAGEKLKTAPSYFDNQKNEIKLIIDAYLETNINCMNVIVDGMLVKEYFANKNKSKTSK